MTVEYAKIRFWDAYGVAEFVRQSLEEDPGDERFEEYFDFSDQDTMQRCLDPSRWTLLHPFTQDRYREAYIEDFEHDRDDMRDLIIDEYLTVLRGYDIPFPQHVLPAETSDEYDVVSGNIIAELRGLLPIERIVCETFQLLFANRLFLKAFNETVANVIRSLKVDDYPDSLERDGMLCRAYLPAWAKRGVFYRDQGRCVLCGKDLTGTVVTGESLAYDHIVPLAVGGTNDPTNFQLLCRDCNSNKDRRTITSDQYAVYWAIDAGLLGVGRRRGSPFRAPSVVRLVHGVLVPNLFRWSGTNVVGPVHIQKRSRCTADGRFVDKFVIGNGELPPRAVLAVNAVLFVQETNRLL